GPMDNLRGVALSLDATRLAAACDDQGIRIWDLATGAQSTLQGHARERDVAVRFSPDGNRLVSLSIPEGEDSQVAAYVVRVWNLAARKVLATVEKLTYTWNAPEFSPDGKFLAYADYLHSVIRVFDAATGRETFSSRY